MNDTVLVAVLTFNEGEKLKSLVRRFPQDKGYRLLFVDDGSTDNTHEFLVSLGHCVLRHERNMGVGYGIREAISFGRANNCGIIVVMAGNGKMLPEEIPRLVNPIREDRADYVQGSRNLEGGVSPHLPFGRKIAIRLFTETVNLFLGKRTTDVTCGFRAYRLDLFNDKSIDLDQDWLDRYELEYYIHYKVLTGGYRFAEAPVSMVYPEDGQNYSKIKPFTGWWSILRPWIFLVLRIKK